MISMLGCLFGMAVGLVFCLLQQHFGFIRMSGATFLIESYPVVLKGSDFILVLVTVLAVSLIASAISSRLSVKNTGSLKDDL